MSNRTRLILLDSLLQEVCICYLQDKHLFSFFTLTCEIMKSVIASSGAILDLMLINHCSQSKRYFFQLKILFKVYIKSTDNIVTIYFWKCLLRPSLCCLIHFSKRCAIMQVVSATFCKDSADSLLKTLREGVISNHPTF